MNLLSEGTTLSINVVIRVYIYYITIILFSLSKNPIGDEGFELVLDALIAKPATLTKLG